MPHTGTCRRRITGRAMPGSKQWRVRKSWLGCLAMHTRVQMQPWLQPTTCSLPPATYNLQPTTLDGLARKAQWIRPA
eukprot:353459-Chlamydomonas_euryale.AAC.7